MSRFKLIVGGGDSLIEAMKNMANEGKIKVVPSREKCLYVIADKSDTPILDESESEERNWEKYLFRPDDNGGGRGTIIFSTDVNSKVLSNNRIKNMILKIYSTWKNRFSVKGVIDQIRRKRNIGAWTIGQYLIGAYTGRDGKTYNENSLCIDCVGIKKDDLFEIAEEIKDAFKQESVLVKWNDQVYFVS